MELWQLSILLAKAPRLTANLQSVQMWRTLCFGFSRFTRKAIFSGLQISIHCGRPPSLVRASSVKVGLGGP